MRGDKNSCATLTWKNKRVMLIKLQCNGMRFYTKLGKTLCLVSKTWVQNDVWWNASQLIFACSRVDCVQYMK